MHTGEADIEPFVTVYVELLLLIALSVVCEGVADIVLVDVLLENVSVDGVSVDKALLCVKV